MDRPRKILRKEALHLEFHRTPIEDDGEDGEADGSKVRNLIGWLKKNLELVPEPYRSEAMIKIEGAGNYDGDNAVEITIFWEREENSEEYLTRIDAEDRALAKRMKAREDGDRAQYERLKAKFEGRP